jgi:hypothetical protein
MYPWYMSCTTTAVHKLSCEVCVKSNSMQAVVSASSFSKSTSCIARTSAKLVAVCVNNYKSITQQHRDNETVVEVMCVMYTLDQ